MRPSLSLKMSQHLALTPQLQQSIRLLQLSTLELSQEVDQMLDENPFLERAEEESLAESMGLATADTRVSLGDRVSESAQERDDAPEPSDEAVQDVAESGDGDGSVDVNADDSEWGSDAKARNGKPMVNIARIVFYGAVIQVTPGMRMWMHGNGMHLKDTTTHIVIPPRPTIEPAYEAYRDTIVDRYTRAVHGAAKAI